MEAEEETAEERRARWRSITVGGRKPGTPPAKAGALRPMQQPVWEKGKVYDHRPGGFKVPMIHADNPSAPVTVKQYQNNRGGFDRQRDRLRNDPTIFKE